MFEVDIKHMIHNKLIEKNSDEIYQELIDELYVPHKDKKSKGVMTRTFFNGKAIFNNVSYLADTAERNKFMLLSKFHLNEKDNPNCFVYSFKDESLINRNIVSAILEVSSLRTNQLAIFKAYRNTTSNMTLSSEDLTLLNNIFLTYLVSFSTTAFTIKHKTKHSHNKVLNLVENQLSNLPLELPYVEEMKILNKIADNLIKGFFDKKEAPGFTQPNVRNESDGQRRAREAYFLDFRRKIIYIDILFKKNFAISRYIIPFLIKKVKLSNEIIDRFVALCNSHLMENIQAKLVEEEKDTSILTPFMGRRLFELEVGIDREEERRGFYNYNSNELFDEINVEAPSYDAVLREMRRGGETVVLHGLPNREDEIAF